MKLTLVLLTAAFLNVSANGLSQNVTFSGKNVSLEKVFSEVEKQTGFVFFYDVDLLKKTNPVTIKTDNLELETFLNLLLKDQSLKFSIKNKAVFISGKNGAVSTVDLKSEAGFLMPPGSVKGRVTNEDGEALAGANVMIKGTTQGTSTDVNGYYKMENVTMGECTLVVSFIGYATKSAIVKVNENVVATLNFTLSASLVNLDQLTVTSTLSARKIRAYPATIAVISQEDLKNRNLNNIGNVLDAVPGVIVQMGSESFNSGNIRQPSRILIRGTNAGAPIKYLVDGIDVVSDGGKISILQTLDPNDIDKIEVLKGPMASTLYGNGAAGGIISITTKKGKQGKPKINFKGMYTEYANNYDNYKGYNQNYNLNVSGGSEQFNYLFGAGYNFYPITKLSDTSNGINDKTWSYMTKIGGGTKNIIADLSLQYGYENTGSASTVSSQNKYRASIGLSELPVGTLSDVRNFQRNFLTSLHLTHTITNNWYHDLTIGYNITDFSSNNHTIDDFTGTYYNTEYLFSKINARYFMFYDHSWSANVKSSITAGFEYNGYDLHYLELNSTAPLLNFFAVYTPASESSAAFGKSPYSSTGYFAEAVTEFKNNLFLTTGIRYDVNPAYGDNVGAYPQPRVGLSYVIEADKWKIKPRAVWGVSSNAPDPTYKITNTTLTTPFYNIVNIGNPDIKPQRSVGYECGADIFYGSNYSLNLTYYDQRIKDMIQNSYTINNNTNPLTIEYYYFNVAQAINKGLELSAKAVVDPFIVDLSYTQTTSKWGDVTGQTSTGVIYPGAPSVGVPKRSAFARLTFRIPSLLTWSKKEGKITLDWKYNGSSFSYDEIKYTLDRQAWLALPTPRPPAPDINNYYLWQKSYSYFNLRADHYVTNFAVLYIDIQNLLNKHGSVNGQTLSQFPGRRINFGFNITF